MFVLPPDDDEPAVPDSRRNRQGPGARLKSSRGSRAPGHPNKRRVRKSTKRGVAAGPTGVARQKRARMRR